MITMTSPNVSTKRALTETDKLPWGGMCTEAPTDCAGPLQTDYDDDFLSIPYGYTELG